MQLYIAAATRQGGRGDFLMRVEKSQRTRRKGGTFSIGCAGRLPGNACPVDAELP
jgi:hypothetical protein